MEQIVLTVWNCFPVTPTEAEYFVDLVVAGSPSYFRCILFYREAIPTRLLKSPLKAYRYIHQRLNE
jgi:hypothetical protein